ncbi:MAG TPA: M23 family metallopeptidase [Candidatus Borkfalkia excrementavium]|uniref:M23 family metallopeptidase n=1 Tax=Candidatus Borkfalkia excrementavium TaxID=2838505 RepID=A0A9D1Z7A8_9FIRM|nr:M23 family metallopeptidase [Candidatus Borkfalkia excrementavium]
MKEKKNTESGVPEKAKKRNLYFILLAACALVLVAAITFTVVMVTRDSGTKIEAPDDPDDPDDPDEPTDADPVFSMPVNDATVGTTFTFWYNSTLDRYNLHEGIDFKAEAGTNVAAAYAGTVKSISDTLLEGGCIVIDHGDGLETVYASVDAEASLKVGDTVERGDIIGTVSAAADVMGNEYDEGTHLHFEVRQDEKAIDPTTYLDIDEK